MPPVSVSGHEVTRGLVACISEFGDFAAQVARAMDDGTVTKDELARICADGQTALAAILRVMELARNAQKRGA